MTNSTTRGTSDIATEANQALQGIAPGPWEYRDIIDGLHNVVDMAGWDIAQCSGGVDGVDPDNKDREIVKARTAAFIASSPSLVRRLVDEVVRLRALVQQNG